MSEESWVWLAAWRRRHRDLLIAKAEALALTKPFRPPRPMLTSAELIARAEARPGPLAYTVLVRRPGARRARRARQLL